jgi:hypothetical protein
MGKEKETFLPVRQSVHVDCPIEDAFRLFTEAFAEWWPLESCSVSGDDAESCAIEPRVGGKVFERTRSGEQREWGSVTVWDPPDRLALTWHPATRRDGSQTVTVDFQVEADGTRVTLTHFGWQWAGVVTAASCFACFVSEQVPVAV